MHLSRNALKYKAFPVFGYAIITFLLNHERSPQYEHFLAITKNRSCLMMSNLDKIWTDNTWSRAKIVPPGRNLSHDDGKNG